MKKITVAVVAISLFATVSCFAKEKGLDFSDVDEKSGYVMEVNALTESGIIQGDDKGNFRPDDEITRAEFAAVLCRTMGVEDDANTENMKNQNYFTDVSPEHWAAGYINAAYDFGAINGVGAGIFMPESPVTNEQVIKMLVAAWGYTLEAEELGGYPKGYMEVAHKYGVLDTVLFNYGNVSKRWVVSMFVYGVLDRLPVSENAERKPSPPNIIYTENAVFEREPMPENSEYVKDPISVLQNISNDSVGYERKVFEQSVPENMLPFVIENNMLFGTDGSLGYYMQIVNPDEKGSLVEGITDIIKGISLENLPQGEWEIAFNLNIGAISDQYFHVIVKNKNEVYFQGFAQRYTELRVRAISTEERHNVEISNAVTNERVPFEIKTASDGKGKTILYIDYAKPIEANQYLSFGLSSSTDDIYSSAVPIEGYMERIQPIVVENLAPNIEYNFQIMLGEKTGNLTSFKGIFELNENGDFSLKGDLVMLAILGYKIDDLE